MKSMLGITVSRPALPAHETRAAFSRALRGMLRRTARDSCESSPRSGTLGETAFFDVLRFARLDLDQAVDALGTPTAANSPRTFGSGGQPLYSTIRAKPPTPAASFRTALAWIYRHGSADDERLPVATNQAGGPNVPISRSVHITHGVQSPRSVHIIRSVRL